jgi:hypothetical protein
VAEADEFMLALAGSPSGPPWPQDERLIVCGFPGDPGEQPPNAWRPRPWKPGTETPLGSECNGYVTVSSFFKAPDGSWRRRQDGFAAGRALMVDDVGTKVDSELVRHFPPSAIVETSPRNFQWWYFLREPLRDMDAFDQVIRSFIAGKLLGADPGMAGVNRVGRLPGYINGKAKYGGAFRCRTVALSDARFTPDELVDAFGLKLVGSRRPLAGRRLLPEDIEDRAQGWVAAHEWLRQRKMFRRDDSDAAGWWEMTCPWIDDHTDRANSGAALREPAEDNGFYGAFRCHHGHCGDKDWRALTDWIAEAAIEELDRANAADDWAPAIDRAKEPT